MDKSFDVFLSHNSKDKPAVRELAEALRARGLTVWIDEWELVPGRPWQEALEDVIETCRSSAVLVGKDGLSPWHAAEMRGCLTEFVRRKLPVIPVLLPGASAEPRLPLFLTQVTWVDLRSGLTKEGLDRLQWGVTGKRPDRSKTPPGPPSAPETSFGHTGGAFTEPLTGIRFLWIPGGRFQMGGRLPDEQPVHWARISSFWLAETPVTNQQYAVFLAKTGGRKTYSWLYRWSNSAPEQPVVNENWYDAQKFCAWLSKVSGQCILLPSEAQWEYAARGTDGREYPWGNEAPDETRACFQGHRPALVGTYPLGQGPFGTLDQAGNVWEWCRDAWDKKAYLKPEHADEAIDPVLDTQDAKERVLRGGGWIGPAVVLRAAFRMGISAGTRGSGAYGFRVAAVPSSTSNL